MQGYCLSASDVHSDYVFHSNHGQYPTNFNYVLNEVPGTGCSVAQACQDKVYLLSVR